MGETEHRREAGVQKRARHQAPVTPITLVRVGRYHRLDILCDSLYEIVGSVNMYIVLCFNLRENGIVIYVFFTPS